jgi:hypothetical protein
MLRALAVTCLVLGCGSRPAAPVAPAEPTGGALAGLVLDGAGGEPLGFATVRAWSEQRERGSFTTSSDGRFRIEALPPGSYRVIASYAGRSVTATDVQVGLGRTTEIEVTVPAPARAELTEERPDLAVGAGPAGPLGAIEGQVIDASTGDSMPGQVISASSDVLGQPVFAVSDGDGRFRFAALRPGTYALTVYYHLISRGNIEVRRSGITVTAGQTSAAEIRVDIEVDE